MNSNRLEQLKKNLTFFKKYLGGECIDSKLVSKFISTIQTSEHTTSLFRVELETGGKRKAFRRRIMSTSDCKKGAAKGCMSMLHHRIRSGNEKLFDGRNARLNVYEIKHATVFVNFEELNLLGQVIRDTEFIPSFDHLETEREFLIRPPEHLVLVDRIDLRDTKNDDIFFYE